MKWPSWNQLLLPTVLVGCMWLICSSATTYAILWLERGYQSVLSENVPTIESVGEMQHALWSLQDAIFRNADKSPSTRPADLTLNGGTAEFLEALDKAERTALTDLERTLVARIRKTFEDYLNDLRNTPTVDDDPIPGERAFELAAQISELSNQLLEMNQGFIREHTIFYESWSRRIRWAGMTLTVLGPLLGTWLGFRAAERLKQRITRLRVTLASVSGELGPIEVLPETAGDDLVDLDQQATNAANRIRDILKQLEDARSDALRNERLAAVGQLAAGVAHELRNPLTSVKLLVQTAAAQAESRSDERQQFQVIQTEIERMERTIQSLLDFARPHVQHRIRHDLKMTVARAINLVQLRAERDRVTIMIEPSQNRDWQSLDSPQCGDALPMHMPVTGDPDLLHQVFVNLLLNGIEAMPDGGTLRVSYEELHRNGSARATECDWRVLVRDQGSGIPPGELEHIFEPFVTTKARGTGLGLAVSRRIIDEHHGRLTAQNHPAGGAVFVVELPFASD